MPRFSEIMERVPPEQRARLMAHAQGDHWHRKDSLCEACKVDRVVTLNGQPLTAEVLQGVLDVAGFSKVDDFTERPGIEDAEVLLAALDRAHR